MTYYKGDLKFADLGMEECGSNGPGRPKVDNPKRQRGVERRFVSWDGEGITYVPNTPQSYVLFGNSDGETIKSKDLDTVSCLDLLLASDRNAIHVGFALGYDCNMILKDLPHRHLWQLYRTNSVNWNRYHIEHIPGKWLYVKKGNTPGVRLYDVFSFFQSSFVRACEDFIGKDDPELEPIRAGKLARRTFQFDELDSMIVPYWQGELRLLIRLMDSLRSDLLGAGLKVSSWHGPGAVANTVFRKFNVMEAKDESPTEVLEASRFGYAGGRFELFRCGHYPGTVYEYDINSAYPSVIADLPNLRTGNWEYVREFEPGTYGIWNLRYENTDGIGLESSFAIHPLFHRGEHGEVSFPPITSGWYWTPEAGIAFPRSEIFGGWVLRHDDSKPFGFVHDMYRQRLEWKRQGNSAQRALKLALNSLYGKTAQRSGYKPGRPIPRWHQLDWAGFVTSMVRAKLFNAISTSQEDCIIAVETDAIFSTQPIPNLEIGPDLGSWELTTFEWMTYIQSGMYYGSVNGTTIEKYRGFDKGSLPHSQMQSYLSLLDNAIRQSERLDCVRVPTGETTRFVGMGLGLRTRATWRAWETASKQVKLGGGGKRAHVSVLCPQCKSRQPFSTGLHDLICTPTKTVESWPHSLPWLTDESDAQTFADLDQQSLAFA